MTIGHCMYINAFFSISTCERTSSQHAFALPWPATELPIISVAAAASQSLSSSWRSFNKISFSHYHLRMHLRLPARHYANSTIGFVYFQIAYTYLCMYIHICMCQEGAAVRMQFKCDFYLQCTITNNNSKNCMSIDRKKIKQYNNRAKWMNWIELCLGLGCCTHSAPTPRFKPDAARSDNSRNDQFRDWEIAIQIVHKNSILLEPDRASEIEQGWAEPNEWKSKAYFDLWSASWSNNNHSIVNIVSKI